MCWRHTSAWMLYVLQTSLSLSLCMPATSLPPSPQPYSPSTTSSAGPPLADTPLPPLALHAPYLAWREFKHIAAGAQTIRECWRRQLRAVSPFVVVVVVVYKKKWLTVKIIRSQNELKWTVSLCCSQKVRKQAILFKMTLTNRRYLCLTLKIS